MLTISWGFFCIISIFVLLGAVCYGALIVLWPILKIIGQLVAGLSLLAIAGIGYALSGLLWLSRLIIDLCRGKTHVQFRWRPQAMRRARKQLPRCHRP